MNKIRITITLIFLTVVLAVMVCRAWPEILLSERVEEPDGVQWFDDYFTLQVIDEMTIAIGEPRYYQQNYSYLILGKDRAILLDTGPGLRDIRAVVDSLTKLPVTAVSSHLHYDHIGNHDRFDQVAMVDLPGTRNRMSSGEFSPAYSEHLGFLEGIEKPSFRVSQWWLSQQKIDLGGRIITVISAPGHTPESIVLLDEERDLLFSGDFIYEGQLLLVLPGSNLDQYHESAQKLLEVVSDNTLILGAHRWQASSGAPVMGYEDLAALTQSLAKIRTSELERQGFILNTYPVNSRMEIIVY